MKQRKGCDKEQSGHSKTNSKFGVFGNCGHFLLENAIHQIAKNIVEQVYTFFFLLFFFSHT
jgi:hypothetical protein